MATSTHLTEIFQLHLDAVPSGAAKVADRFHGPRGWLVASGASDVIAPFVTRLPADDRDLARFAGLDAPAAAALLDLLTPDQLSDRQNDAPTLGSMLRAAVAHSGRVELHGYLVGPGRDDERITAEGVYVYVEPDLYITARHDDGCQCGELWKLVERELGINDAVCFPHEVDFRLNRWRPEEPCWSLWWD